MHVSIVSRLTSEEQFVCKTNYSWRDVLMQQMGSVEWHRREEISSDAVWKRRQVCRWSATVSNGECCLIPRFNCCLSQIQAGKYLHVFSTVSDETSSFATDLFISFKPTGFILLWKSSSCRTLFSVKYLHGCLWHLCETYSRVRFEAGVAGLLTPAGKIVKLEQTSKFRGLPNFPDHF